MCFLIVLNVKHLELLVLEQEPIKPEQEQSQKSPGQGQELDQKPRGQSQEQDRAWDPRRREQDAQPARIGVLAVAESEAAASGAERRQEPPQTTLGIRLPSPSPPPGGSLSLKSPRAPRHWPSTSIREQ